MTLTEKIKAIVVEPGLISLADLIAAVQLAHEAEDEIRRRVQALTGGDCLTKESIKCIALLRTKLRLLRDADVVYRLQHGGTGIAIAKDHRITPALVSLIKKRYKEHIH